MTDIIYTEQEGETMGDDGLPITLQIVLGSLVVHIEEMLDEADPNARNFDERTIRSLIEGEELQEWLDGLRKQAFLPVKRK